MSVFGCTRNPCEKCQRQASQAWPAREARALGEADNRSHCFPRSVTAADVLTFRRDFRARWSHAERRFRVKTPAVASPHKCPSPRRVVLPPSRAVRQGPPAASASWHGRGLTWGQPRTTTSPEKDHVSSNASSAAFSPNPRGGGRLMARLSHAGPRSTWAEEAPAQLSSDSDGLGASWLGGGEGRGSADISPLPCWT